MDDNKGLSPNSSQSKKNYEINRKVFTPATMKDNIDDHLNVSENLEDCDFNSMYLIMVL